MKHSLRSGKYIFPVIVLLFVLGMENRVIGQVTEGEMTFKVTTITTGKGFTPKHVLAVWVEDSKGFRITNLLRADKRKQYLYKWNNKSGGNTTDATTGATMSSHDPITVTWNCKGIDKSVLPDGEYTVFVEFTEEHAQGPIYSLSFTKGTSEVSLTPSNVVNFKDISLTYVPSVPSAPVAGFSFTKDGLSVNFTNSSTDATSYSWDFGDSNSSTEASPSHTYTTAGTYDVVLTATSDVGSDSETQSITVSESTGIDDAKTQLFTVFPNPASDIIYVRSDAEMPAESFEIFNLNGQLVKSGLFSNRYEFSIVLDDVNPGLYVLRILSGDEKMSVQIEKN